MSRMEAFAEAWEQAKAGRRVWLSRENGLWFVVAARARRPAVSPK